jgi:hypothetical protein
VLREANCIQEMASNTILTFEKEQIFLFQSKSAYAGVALETTLSNQDEKLA